MEELNFTTEMCHLICSTIRNFAENFGFLEDIKERLEEVESKISEKTAPEKPSAEKTGK